MEKIMEILSPYLPADFDPQSYLHVILFLILGSVVLGLIGRFAFGKRSSLNHAVSSAMGILFLYIISAVIIATGSELETFMTPLPFSSMNAEVLTFISIPGADFTEICTHVLRMIILAFAVNVLDSFVPKGKKIIGWFVREIVIVALAFVAQWFINYLFTAILPEAVLLYAPAVLVCVLVFMVLLGALKVILGLVLAAVNPIIAALYTFFFANKIGKSLTKAMLTTILLTGLVAVMTYFGCNVIPIAAEALMAYVPLVLLLLVLWYVIGKVL